MSVAEVHWVALGIFAGIFPAGNSIPTVYQNCLVFGNIEERSLKQYLVGEPLSDKKRHVQNGRVELCRQEYLESRFRSRKHLILYYPNVWPELIRGIG